MVSNDENIRLNETSRLLGRKIETPLPKAKMAILLVCLLADALSITVIYPIAPYMIQDFLQFDEEDQSAIGTYAGFLASAYTVGQMFGSPFWGNLSDRIGRRPVILAGMIGNILFLNLFGFSRSYWVALILRFSQGLSSGNIPVIKTYIADISDETNESKAFAYVAVVFGVGIGLGPALGALLVDPAMNIPSIFSRDSIFGQNKYLLPMFVISIKIFIDILFAYFYLPESHHREEREKDMVEKIMPGTPRGMVRGLEAAVASPAVPDIITGMKSRSPAFHIVVKCVNFRKICMLHIFVGLCSLGFWEILPVYARLSPNIGGLGFLVTDIGSLQSAAGFFILTCSIVLYARLSDLFGCVRLYRVGILVYAVAVIIPVILRAASLTRQDTATWLLMLMAMLLYSLAGNLVFTSFTIMVKSAVPSKYAGTGIGISQSVGNLGYAMGPIFGGSLFSWLAKFDTISFPFDHGLFYFVILEFILIITFSMSVVLPPWPWSPPLNL